ncbi:MAG: hypothetical protein M3328_13430 [Chloroflexota bacterium]|nr:hypothetical protein [Chloroflexota bacterium]
MTTLLMVILGGAYTAIVAWVLAMCKAAARGDRQMHEAFRRDVLTHAQRRRPLHLVSSHRRVA